MAPRAERGRSVDEDNWGDEFEVEVTDLRTGQRTDAQRRAEAGPPLTPLVGQPIVHSAPIAEGMAPTTPVEISLLPRSPRARATVAVCVTLLVALALVILPGSPLAITSAVVRATPTATVTVDPGSSTFYSVDMVPWGTLRVDGKSTVPVDDGSGYPSITLGPGAHTIEYIAAPFPEVKCRVVVPDNGGDTCPLAPNDGALPTPPIANARMLDLRATMANLPPSEVSALQAKIEAALSKLTARAQLDAGDHYLDASGSVQTARVGMLGILTYSLNPETQQGQGCSAICDENGIGAGPNGTSWVVVANMIEHWRYLLSTGQSVPGPQIVQNGGVSTVFGVTWTGSWQVTSLENTINAACESGFNVLGQDISSANPTFFQDKMTQNGGGSSSNLADGCVVSFTPTAGGNGPTPTGPTAYFLYRCGVVLVVNQAANAILPNQPTVSAHEQQIAQQLIATMSPR